MDLTQVVTRKDTLRWVPYGESALLISATCDFSQLNLNLFDAELRSDALCSFLADQVVKGWIRVFDPAGRLIGYSKELARKALAQNPEIVKFVMSRVQP